MGTCIYTLLIIVSYIELSYGQFAELFMVEPGNTTVASNQMNNVTFRCTCTQCSSILHWSLYTNTGTILLTDDALDRGILDESGITFSELEDGSSIISIPDNAVDYNCTLISCTAFLFGGTEFSTAVKLTIIGPPLPPDPVLVINSSSQLDILWDIPFSHENYSIESYNIHIVNTSSGAVLERAQLQSNETSYVYTFEDDVRHCQILTVNVTAVSSLGSSVPGSVTRGFPIAPHPFQMDIHIAVTFLVDGTPTANISFKAPFICDYQTAIYTLIIEDTTNPELQSLTRQSTYTGRSRSIVEVFTSGLKVNRNYALFISVIEKTFQNEVSVEENFTTDFQSTDTGAPILASWMCLCIAALCGIISIAFN